MRQPDNAGVHTPLLNRDAIHILIIGGISRAPNKSHHEDELASFEEGAEYWWRRSANNHFVK